MNNQMLRDIFAARPKSLAFVGFLALLALVLRLYLSLWQQPELEKAQLEWFAKRDALAKGEVVGDSTRYHQGVRDLELFQQRLIRKEEFPAFLSRLYATAHDNSLTLKGITYKPEKAKENPGIVTYGISFTVSGRYASVKSFLADLVRYREMVTVDSIALDSSSPVEEQVQLRVQTTVYLKTEGA